MPASLQRGYTFGATEQVTNTKLHNLVDNGTVTGVDETTLASGRGLVVRSTSQPSNTNSLWVDTNFSTPLIKVYTGAAWVPNGPYAVLTNKSGGQRVAGDVVVVRTDADSAFTTTTTANDTTIAGVVMETVADNASGVVALPGAICDVKVTGATTRGQFLASSTTLAKADPSTAGVPGAFAIALTASSSVVTAILIGTVAISGATQAQMEAAASNAAMVTPLAVKWHPGVAKAWGVFDGTGTPAYLDRYNMDATITDNGAGDYTLTITNDLASGNYALAGSAIPGSDTAASVNIKTGTSPAGGSFNIRTMVGGSNLDSAHVGFVLFGDLP